MLKKMKIGYKLFLLVVIFISGFLLFGVYASKIINDIKINGEMYKKIIMEKDLLADILPPPEYIVESHFTTLELLNENDKRKIEELVNYEGKLEKDYNIRNEVWSNSLPESNMKKIFTEDSYKPAKEYFKVFNSEFVPYIKSGDKEKAKDILENKLEKLYGEHRSNIDKVVELVNKESLAIEQSIKSKIKFDLILLASIAFFISISVVIFCICIIKVLPILYYFLDSIYRLLRQGILVTIYLISG